MPTLLDVFKDIEKISGKGSVMEGVEVKDVARISTPITMLNYMMYGGIPKGRLIEFSGAESSGKTSTALLVAAAYQKQDNRPVFFVDAEGTYDARWTSLLGVDNSKGKFIKWSPENSTAEQVMEMILSVASTNEVGLIILDSIPALVPQQEDAKTLTEYQVGGISKPLTVFARKLQKILLQNDTVTFIGLNQVRDNMSQYGPTTTTVGGHAWKHMCSIRLEFKSENIDENGNYMSDNADSPTAVKINVAVKKNKTAPRNRKLGSYVIDFMKGFNDKMDLFLTALLFGIIVRRGSSYTYTNTKTGEVVLTALGKASFIEKMDQNSYNLLKVEVAEYGN